MARSSSEAGGQNTARRGIAGCLLGIEVLWWAAGTPLITAGAGNATLELLGAASVVLMFLTLLAIFLVIRAPRGGVWLGLLLQVAVLALAVPFAFMSFIGIFFVFPLAIITALALAVAWPRQPQR